jgi:flagella basal body P-ring formation protein FlgA
MPGGSAAIFRRILPRPDDNLPMASFLLGRLQTRPRRDVMQRLFYSILVGYIALTPLVMADTQLQSHESILTAIREFIESNFRHSGDSHDIEIAPLDYRLRLPECSRPIEVFTRPGSRDIGNISVGVRCQGEQPWSIYHKANIRLYKEVTLLKNPVRQGAILTPDDITLTRKDVAQLHGASLSPEQVIDKSVKKSLAAGTVLNADHLATPKLVKRGQKVLLRAQNAHLEVTMSGDALKDGEEGQRIRVRNEESKRIVEGTVTGSNIINIAY